MDDDMTASDIAFALEPPPRQADVLRDLWRDMKVVKSEVKRTNGRVSRVERVLLAAGALVIGFLLAYGLDLPRIPGL
jgi:hypothetical protein